ncbi:MAG: hypothetical protein OEY06_07450 [Gammaproteobacteria bacterium]|nr:hypothetical protein [Gammaproteobacteria bacterium]
MNAISLITMEDKNMLRSIINNCLLIFFCLFSTFTNASNFLLVSEINARVTYDDNINASATGNDESSSIVKITPKIKLKYTSDAWETAVNASVAGTTYSADYQDNFDAHLDLETAYKDNRNIYSAFVGYDNFSSRTAEENVLAESLEQTDTKKLSLAPKYSHLLTERLSLSLAYQYSDVKYTSASQRYLPYETTGASGEVEYKLSQKSQLSFLLTSTDYSSENDISEYHMLASKFGIDHDFSEMITSKLFVGVNTRDFSTRSAAGFNFLGSNVTGTQAVEGSNSGATFEAVIDAKWIEFGASRNVVPNFTGGLDQTDTIHTKLRMKVTALIGIVLAINQVSIEELNDNVVDYSRSFTTIIPAMNFSLAHNLNLRAEYFYSKNNYEGVSQDEIGKNKFAVNLKYDFPSI